MANECQSCKHWAPPEAHPNNPPEWRAKYERHGECQKITNAGGPEEGVVAYATACCCGEGLWTLATFGCRLFEAKASDPSPAAPTLDRYRPSVRCTYCGQPAGSAACSVSHP
jgi:hypothetical protein